MNKTSRLLHGAFIFCLARFPFRTLEDPDPILMRFSFFGEPFFRSQIPHSFLTLSFILFLRGMCFSLKQPQSSSSSHFLVVLRFSLGSVYFNFFLCFLKGALHRFKASLYVMCGLSFRYFFTNSNHNIFCNTSNKKQWEPQVGFSS